MLLTHAKVHPFPQRLDAGNRLTVRDKIELHAAGERITAAGLRCVIGRDGGGPGQGRRSEAGEAGSDPLSHDFLQLLRVADASIAWTVVRSGPRIRVWHGSNGPDLDLFPSLADALEAALNTAPYSYRQALAGRAARGSH